MKDKPGRRVLSVNRCGKARESGRVTMKLVYIPAVFALTVLLSATALSSGGGQALSKAQAEDKVKRMEVARDKLKSLANAPIPSNLSAKVAKRYQNQQALTDVAATKLRLEAFQLKRAARKMNDPVTTISFVRSVSATDIVGAGAEESPAIRDFNAEVVKVFEEIDSNKPLESLASDEELLTKQQIAQKIKRLEVAAESLLSLANTPAPAGLSQLEQKHFSQSLMRTELMGKKLQLQKLQLQRSLASMKSADQTIPFNLNVSKQDVAATGRRSSVRAVKDLYGSILMILEAI